MTERPIRVVLINDFPLVLAGLRAMLAPYSARVQVTGAALGVPPQREPVADIGLFDSFGETDVEQRVRRLMAQQVARHLVIFSWSADEATKRAAVAAGARAYLPKRLPPAQMVRALEHIHTGVDPGDPDPVGSGVDGAGAWPGQDAGLVEREAEVLALITQGLRNEEIAKVLYLSINSIKRYIRSTYRKIGVSSRTEALLWALDHGFTRDGTGAGGLGAQPPR